jgi:hypothetical protein
MSANSDNLELYAKDLNNRSMGVIPILMHLKRNGTVFPVEISACGFMWRGRRTLCAIARDVTCREQATEKEIQM